MQAVWLRFLTPAKGTIGNVHPSTSVITESEIRPAQEPQPSLSEISLWKSSYALGLKALANVSKEGAMKLSTNAVNWGKEVNDEPF